MNLGLCGPLGHWFLVHVGSELGLAGCVKVLMLFVVLYICRFNAFAENLVQRDNGLRVLTSPLDV